MGSGIEIRPYPWVSPQDVPVRMSRKIQFNVKCKWFVYVVRCKCCRRAAAVSATLRELRPRFCPCSTTTSSRSPPTLSWTISHEWIRIVAFFFYMPALWLILRPSALATISVGNRWLGKICLLNGAHAFILILETMPKRKDPSSNTSDTENNAQDVPQPQAKCVNANKYSGMKAEQALGEF